MLNRPRDPRRSGFSLLELMVTMSLAALLIAAGAGVYVKMGRRTAATQAIGSVGQLITRARNASMRYPATIVADAEQGLLHAYTDELLQELHFEERASDAGPYVPMGIEGRDCELTSGTVVADAGRVGGGAELRGGSINCGTFAAYDVSEGLNAEVWIRPTDYPKCDLVSKGRTFIVRLTAAAGRSAQIQIRLKEQDVGGVQEDVTRVVQIPAVRLGEWLGIRVSYDRERLLTETSDGHGFVVRDVYRDEKRRPLAVDSDAPLVIASGLQGFVDDVRVGGVRSADPIQLPAGVLFVGANAPVHFADGRLDPAFHSGNATLSIKFEGVVSTFEIGPGGQVLAVRQSDAPPAEPPKGAEPQPVPLKKE